VWQMMRLYRGFYFIAWFWRVNGGNGTHWLDYAGWCFVRAPRSASDERRFILHPTELPRRLNS
jgi:hypothetical protein